MTKVWKPEEFSAALGADAMRLAMGAKLKNFTPQQVVGLLMKVADKAQPLRACWPVLDAHAQFGGDIEDMQRRYDQNYEPVFAALSNSERTDG